MATVSATQPIRTITPPSSSHGGGGSWDYAISADTQNAFNNRGPYDSDLIPKSTQQPLVPHTNGFSKPVSSKFDTASDVVSLSKSLPRNEYLATAPNSELNRKHGDMSSRSEPDSLVEIYKSQARNKSVPSGIENANKRKISNGYHKTAEDDDDNWIHRDKLAQIESRELEEAGFKVAAVTRSFSRSRSRSHGSSMERHRQTDLDEDLPGVESLLRRDDDKQFVTPTLPAEDDVEEFMEWELRRPEEVAAEQQEMFTPIVRPPPRPKGSRLPILKPSGVSPVSVERDSPAAKSRNASGNFGPSGIPEPRSRSRSVGSTRLNLYDVDNDGRPHTPVRSSLNSSEKESSPQKTAKVPSKVAPTSGARKTNTARNVSASKPRQPSQNKNDSSPKRPGTSSGLARPSTSHRPEGDPPWLATMYKPDPRLPPDQQMLPTHAKRLAQEQWEKEGKTGTIYDKEFRLLNADTFPEPKSPVKEAPPEVAELEKPVELTPKWPSQPSPVGSPRSQTSPIRPGTSGTEHGGYKTMPTIHAPPTPTQAAAPPAPPKPIRVPEPQDSAKEEKSGLCGCCIIM